MTLFVDSANPVDIQDALVRGVIGGVTTNPSLISQQERVDDYEVCLAQLVQLVRPYKFPISVEVTTMLSSAMCDQAIDLRHALNYDHLSIKIPIGWDELVPIRKLASKGVRVNVTAVMTPEQALLAIESGASYISIFWNRIKDGGGNPYDVVAAVRRLLERHHHNGGRIIVGSIRTCADVTHALACGADIVTVPPRILKEMSVHPKTTEVVEQFMRDYALWHTKAPSLT